jgi:hypothetical protein
MSSGGDIINILLTLRNQIKIYHWQTGSFARHKSTDDLVSSLDENIDKFVEVHMGRYGVPHFSKKSGKIVVHDAADKSAANLLHAGVEFLQKNLHKFLKKTDTDLLNIRDEILADLNKAIFLFRLR